MFSSAGFGGDAPADPLAHLRPGHPRLLLTDDGLAAAVAGRWGQSEEVAGTAIYLASRASQFVTGETIPVNGGYAIR